MITDYNERIEVYVCLRELQTKAPQSDLQVRCYFQENFNWKLVAETEVCTDNPEPNFHTPFSIIFYFEIQQPILFEIVNVNNPNAIEVLGTTETTVGSIMGARRQTSSYDLKLKDTTVPGQLITQAEKVGSGVDHIFWKWQGIKLMNTDGRGAKSDPLLRFLKTRPGGDTLKVHETEVLLETLNPTWKPFEIPAHRLCYENNDPFRVECWDWERGGKFQYIGHCEVTLDMLNKGITEFELTNPKYKGKTGTLKVSNFSVQTQASFVDYIRGGTQLNCVVAIDFTGSNGNPSDPKSLHAMLPDSLNEYQKAITAVCEIILNYDYDQLVPVYGFGGKPHFQTMNMNIVSHCFPLTGSLEQQQVLGLQGILDVYKYALNSVELAGPTYFAPLINEAMNVCKVHKQHDMDIYSILLILTDGEIHDMDKTIDKIVEASDLPLSIIIIGIGNTDFAKMVILDGDKGLSNNKGQKVVRDSVQFVPFKTFNGDMVQLAQHVLQEVPDQLVKYMKMMGKKPKEPKPV